MDDKFKIKVAVKPKYSALYILRKKIDIPNGMVDVLIGKGGKTINHLRFQFGAKIQITCVKDADPNSPTRIVEIMGNLDAIASAEKRINQQRGGYGAGYAQTPPSRYAQPKQGSQRTPPSSYGGAVELAYGTPQSGQSGYGGAVQPTYGTPQGVAVSGRKK